MTHKQSLLYISALLPVLVVMLVAVANWQQPVKLRLLTWTGPTLPIGAWLTLAGSSGMILGLAKGILAFQQPYPYLIRRWVQREPRFCAEDLMTPANSSSTRESTVELTVPKNDLGNPFPTVTVPFRIIRHGSSRQTVQPRSVRTNNKDFSASTGEDWGNQSAEDW